jgi:CRP-like cAMP-binding protein
MDPLEPHLLARFAPFDRLEYSALTTLARHCRVLTLPAGRLLVRPGTRVHGNYYLVAGRLAIETSAGRAPSMIEAGSPAARQPLQLSGAIGAVLRTLTPVRALWVDVERVGFLLEQSTGGGYDVAELPQLSGGDWLRILLGSVLGRALPARELTLLLARGRPIVVAAAQRIVSSGEPGDAFYVIEAGRARVSQAGHMRAELGPGACFGEESLLGVRPRNADVTMAEAGRLLCFDAAAFDALVRPAVVAVQRGNARGAGPRRAGRRLAETVLDLDRPPWRDGDWRALIAGLPAAPRYRVQGGTAAQRCHAAYLLATGGLDACVDG